MSDQPTTAAVPLCGQADCPLCPTQADLDAYQRRQWHDAGRAVAEATGLHYDERDEAFDAGWLPGETR